MISGKTLLIAHLGFPTETFKSPLIYNPFFEKSGIDAVVVPMGVQAVDFPSFLPELFKLTNIRGAFVTMPHKKMAIEIADEVSPTAHIAGAANVVRKRDDGSLVADLFDGEGFVRGVLRKGRELAQRSALIVGAGGVGSAIFVRPDQPLGSHEDEEADDRDEQWGVEPDRADQHRHPGGEGGNLADHNDQPSPGPTREPGRQKRGKGHAAGVHGEVDRVEAG